MPFQGEFASKISHADLMKDPEIRDFLGRCDPLREPSEREGMELTSGFISPPDSDEVLPKWVMSIDGSLYESTASAEEDLFPSTRLGFIKIGNFLINTQEFEELRPSNSRFVDPDKIVRFQEGSESFRFALPSSNVITRGSESVVESFRCELDTILRKTTTTPNDPTTSLRATLFYLAYKRDDSTVLSRPDRIVLYKCPSCDERDLEVFDIPEPQKCENCDSEVYPSDSLRLWEEFDEFQSNGDVMLRVMNVVENLLLIHFIRTIADLDLASLAKISFFRDGPLAVHGPSAWLHAPILKTIYEMNERLESMGQNKMTILGFQKEGYIVDHAHVIDKYISPNSLFCVDDEYRYANLRKGRQPSSIGFGSETHYGQDFIYKTPSGKIFVFALPYSVPRKLSGFADFKTNLSNYEQLATACFLIRTFELDLYSNATLPIALAHKFTAISVSPGGRILDLLTRQLLSS